MKKLLTILGLSAAATFALGGAAEAAYPPGGPGAISIGEPVCNFAANGTLESWSISFTATVNVENASLAVMNPVSDDFVMNLDPSIGTHTYTVDNNTPGVNSTPPMHGNIVVNLSESDMVVSESSPGCLGDDGGPDDPDRDGAFNIEQPECRLEDPDDPTGPIVDWSFDIYLNMPNEAGRLTIRAIGDGNLYYDEVVPAGENSIRIDSSIETFSHLMAPYQAYTVTWIGQDTGADTSANVRACDPPYDPQSLMTVLEPSCTYDESTGDLTGWSFGIDAYSQSRPAAVVVTSDRDSVGETYPFTDSQELHLTIDGDGAFDHALAGHETYTVRLVFDGRVLTEEIITPCPVVDIGGPIPSSTSSTQVTNTTKTLPKTGVAAGGLAVAALVLSGSGFGLVWAARRRGVNLF